MRRSFAIALAAVLLSSSPTGEDKAAWGRDAVAVAKTYLGVRSGSPEVKRMLAYQGLPSPNPWCLAFDEYAWHEARPNLPLPLPKTARVYAFWKKAQHDRWSYETATPRDVAWERFVPRPGDVVVFSHNPDELNWIGHGALSEELLDAELCEVQTIEGNTSCKPTPGTPDQERMGGCVAEKVRHAGVRNFVLLGFVRPR